MKEKKISLRMIPWKHKIVLAVIIALGISLLSVTSLSKVVMIKSVLLYTVLTLASYLDYRFRILPDWIHLVIIAIGFININLVRSLFGIVISPLPFLIMALISKGSIGGGDIKLLGASGFVLGFAQTTATTLIAFLFAVVFYSFGSFYKKEITRFFPFAPFFQAAYILLLIF